MSKLALIPFLETTKGHELWDSLELRLVLNNRTVFILRMNEYIELDLLNLVNKETNEFNPIAHKYVVSHTSRIDEINYIFIKEIHIDL